MFKTKVMKPLILTGVFLLSLSLMSFVHKPSIDDTVTRLGSEFFEVSSISNFTDAERTTILDYVQAEYALQDWRTITHDINVQMLRGDKEDKKKCANVLLDEEAVLSQIDKKLLRYDCAKGTTTPQEQKVLEILNRYAR
jgi:hypothetical protein